MLQSARKNAEEYEKERKTLIKYKKKLGTRMLNNELSFQALPTRQKGESVSKMPLTSHENTRNWALSRHYFILGYQSRHFRDTLLDIYSTQRRTSNFQGTIRAGHFRDLARILTTYGILSVSLIYLLVPGIFETHRFLVDGETVSAFGLAPCHSSNKIYFMIGSERLHFRNLVYILRY